MKYLFVVFNAAAVIIVGWVVADLPQVRDGGDRGLARPEAGLPQISRVDETRRERLTATERSLDSLARLMAQRRRVETDTLLATARRPEPEPEPAPPEDGTERVARAPLPERNLTLLLDGQRRMAMVDGRLVQTGDALPGGGTVTRIGTRSVVVRERRGRRQKLTLPPEQLQLGTLRPGAGDGNVN
ncbi:hypothetical protein [Arhodomonas aquaeolei]|uniref:hypothetical protein n=1 Tax=Arhodomonas aquaeolei TaxID=2369 RepID=UPI0003664104|nr:hypothetical protein [Arhodomonas aquaeolei]